MIIKECNGFEIDVPDEIFEKEDAGDTITVTLIALGPFWGGSTMPHKEKMIVDTKYKMKRNSSKDEEDYYVFVDSFLPWFIFLPKRKLLEHYR